MSDTLLPQCSKCGERHKHLRDLMTCLYSGEPLKDGGVWTAETSAEVCERVASRLERDKDVIVDTATNLYVALGGKLTDVAVMEDG